MNLHDIEDIYELSPMQEGMLFHTLYAPDQGTYVTQQLFTLRGEDAIRALAWASLQMVARHAMLRTSFHWQGCDKPLQVVHREAVISTEVYDWRELPPDERRARLDAFLESDRRRAFDLTRAPLTRLTAIRTGDAEYCCVWTYSHLLLDGWSLNLLLTEIVGLCDAFGQASFPALETPRPYRDYIAWLQRQDRDGAERYWRGVLRGFTAPTPLALRPPGQGPGAGRWGEAVFDLGTRETAALLARTRENGLTLNTALLGAWAVVLSRYSGERDVLFGVTSAGRPADLPGAESMIGLFINTLPLRVRVDSRAAVVPWLRDVQGVYAASREKEYTPLAQIQAWSDVPRGVALFHSLVMLESYPGATTWQPSAPRGERGDGDGRLLQRTNYPLTVCLANVPEGLVGTFSYDPNLFDGDGVRRMAGHFRTVLAAVAHNRAAQVGRLPLLPVDEWRALVQSQTAPPSAHRRDRLIHELFEDQVRRTPDAIAVDCFEKGEPLTYHQLNRRANQLARHLRALGAGPETLVGLCLRRSPRTVTALLGILKSGAGYVPLDPAYPPERLAFMLQDSRAPLLVTDAGSRHVLPDAPVRAVCLDTDADVLDTHDGVNLLRAGCAANVAYVIYTSGSTGQPKGVTIQHGSTVAFLHWVRATYSDDELSGVLATTSLSYDCSVFELLGPLSCGGRIVLADSVLHVKSLPGAAGVTLLSAGPSTLADLLAQDGLPSSVRAINIGGESSPETLLRALASHPGVRVRHVYGPTEDTSYTACEPLGGSHAERTAIGRPLPGTSLHVLDRDGNPVPAGIAGELYIGGEGLARGYWRRPGQTAAAFVPDATDRDPGARLYRTGDLVVCGPDGAVVFLGRRDDQLKVRGTRIEPGEIEHALCAHADVREAAVVARGTAGDRRLVAFYAARPGAQASSRELAQFVRSRMPDAWVPGDYVRLDALPRLPNGKIDRAHLPETLPAPALDASAPPAPPSTPLEQRLAAIWKMVLQRDTIGIHDNFFDLGGHSLSMLHLHCQLRETLAADITLSELFKYPTVAALGARLSSGTDVLSSTEDGRARGAARRALATGRAAAFRRVQSTEANSAGQ